MSNGSPQSNNSLVETLRRHENTLKELRKLFLFGAKRGEIQKAVIDTFEEDLRKIIEELDDLRKEENISLFVSVDAVQEKVSDIVNWFDYSFIHI